MRRRETFAALLTALCIAPSSRAAAIPDGRADRRAAAIVGAPVVAALAGRERVRVIIVFSVPVQPSPRRTDTPRARAAIAAARDDLLRRFAPGEFTLRRSFHSVNAVAGEIRSAGLLRLRRDPSVVRVDLDTGGSGTIADPLPLVHLDTLHSLGLTGNGVTAAVIDSGVDASHPDLGDDVVGEQCFCSSANGIGGCCPNGASRDSGPGSAADDNGHGTNVTGIITSDGTLAPAGGAPDTKIVAIKVLDRQNNFCCASDVIAGLDWVISQRPDVKIVNMSLGTSLLFAGDCDGANAYTMAFATAINTLRARGVLTFAAAGNDGSATQMGAPACVHSALSIGAVYNADIGRFTFVDPPHPVCTDTVTAADAVTCFSNSDAATDLFAPGCPTTSTGLGGGISTFCGTSQATPLTAACAACLLQAQPQASPDQIEAALKTSPTTVVAPQNGLRFPRLDCAAALAALPTPTPPPTVTPLPQAACAGDCDGNGKVTVAEITALVDIILGRAATCPRGTGGVSVNVALVIRAVGNVLNGCGA